MFESLSGIILEFEPSVDVRLDIVVHLRLERILPEIVAGFRDETGLAVRPVPREESLLVEAFVAPLE